MKASRHSRTAPARCDGRRVLGEEAEGLAEAFLCRQGYTVLERNYRAPCGEIDLIVHNGSQLVFVEVKARRGKRLGLPQEAVTPRKQWRIVRTAQWYLQNRGWAQGEIRFDVIGIHFFGNLPPKIEHIVSAFDAP